MLILLPDDPTYIMNSPLPQKHDACLLELPDPFRVFAMSMNCESWAVAPVFPVLGGDLVPDRFIDG